MEQLGNNLSGLITSIEPLIIELAEALGTTVEFIEQNFMFYLVEFGKYQAFISIPGNLLVGLVIAAFLGFSILILIAFLEENIPDKTEEKIFIGLIVFLLLVVILTGIWDLLCYWIAPEIYSATKLIELMG